MDKEKIVKAFDEFVDGKYADSEETLRAEIKQAVNDHLKDKIGLKEDPFDLPSGDESSNDDTGDDTGDEDDNNEE